jgi:hypothetical protein
MVFEITPEPSDEERAAVEAALALEIRTNEGSSAWADSLLPQRDGEAEA